jgi:hypothetical protein
MAIIVNLSRWRRRGGLGGRTTTRRCGRYPYARSAARIACCSSAVNFRRSFPWKLGTLLGVLRPDAPCMCLLLFLSVAELRSGILQDSLPDQCGFGYNCDGDGIFVYAYMHILCIRRMPGSRRFFAGSP